MLSIDRAGNGVAGAGIALACVLALGAMPAGAQETIEGSWLPWLGCWEATSNAGVVDAGGLCVTSAPAGVELLTLADGRVTARRSLIADGERRAVEQSGCAGWESANWSEDGQRVFLNSELVCEGGARRVTSGVIAMTSPSEWVEVQTVDAGGYPAIRALRYRPASAQMAAAAGLEQGPDRALAIETARTAAAAPLSVGDVTEASREVGEDALQMFLFERGGSFEVDANALTRMAEAGVPESVIDLVVALAYPDVFGVNSAARMVAYLPDQPTSAELTDARSPRRVYDRFYDPYDPYGYGYGYYNNRYGSYSPFGWGNPFGWRYSSGPVIVIRPPAGDDVATDRGPSRMVKGRGYTRGARAEGSSSPTRSGSSVSDKSSSSSGGSAASSGSSSGSSSSTTRTAKRRGG